jgi:hypothetical protein
MFRISSKMKKILTITFLLLAHLNVAGAQTGVLPSATQCEVVLSWDAPAVSYVDSTATGGVQYSYDVE